MKKRILLSLMTVFLIGQSSYVSAYWINYGPKNAMRSLSKPCLKIVREHPIYTGLAVLTTGLFAYGVSYFWKNKKNDQKEKDEKNKNKYSDEYYKYDNYNERSDKNEQNNEKQKELNLDFIEEENDSSIMEKST